GYYIRSDATLWKICYEDDELCSKQILDNVLMPGQTPVQPTDPATPVPPITPSISVSPSDIGKFYAKTDIK
ncbi:MAG: hypothetical protein IKM67_03030, partial [Clostridia bacterium]|nr:hypothetical protein [Clostridia bacterium]